MKLGLSVLLGMVFWSGIFFLSQVDAEIPMDPMKDLLIEKLRKKEETLRQEIQEYVITPCRNKFFESHAKAIYGESFFQRFIVNSDFGSEWWVKEHPAHKEHPDVQDLLDTLVKQMDEAMLKLEELVLKMMLETEEGLTDEQLSLEAKIKGEDRVVNVFKELRKLQYFQRRQDCETEFSSLSDTEKEEIP